VARTWRLGCDTDGTFARRRFPWGDFFFTLVKCWLGIYRSIRREFIAPRSTVARLGRAYYARLREIETRLRKDGPN
jgi:hypothetical protein